MFIEWIKRREMLILDSVGHFLFGLTLAEPFQRVSRYCMMIDRESLLLLREQS